MPLQIDETPLFEINVSVPLVLKYKDVTKQYLKEAGPKDDIVLELAVEAQCDYIISFN